MFNEIWRIVAHNLENIYFSNCTITEENGSKLAVETL